MDKQHFETEISRAKKSRALEPERAFYWMGYLRGLKRAYYGENFGTEAEHLIHLQAIEVDDHNIRQRAIGYHDGLQGRSRTEKDYCTQNGGDCRTCSLVNNGLDCMNNSIGT